MTNDRLPLVMFLGLVLVLIVTAGFVTASWVVFGIAMAVYVVATAVVLTGSFRTARAGDESNRTSERLDRLADEAVGNKPRNVETEIEALKREPSQRV